MERKVFRKTVIEAFLWIAAGGVAIVATKGRFLLFHGLAEFFTIGVGFGVFFIAYNTAFIKKNAFIPILGVGLFFVSFFTLLHTLSYKGMGVFPGNDANLPTQLWVAGRLLLAGTFLAASASINRSVGMERIVGAFFFAASALLAAIFLDRFPTAYVEGSGLTPFKIVAEYVTCLALLAASWRVHSNRARLDASVYWFIQASLLFFVTSEMLFTFYLDVDGTINTVAHIANCIGFFCVYKAIVETTIVSPYSTIFREASERGQEL